MTQMGINQIILFLVVTLLLVKPTGWYMARVYSGREFWFEKLIYKICGINSNEDMSWKRYLSSMLFLNLLGLLATLFIQRIQAYLPLNPQGFGNVASDLAFNTAASFASNTDWQNYGGENTLSYLTQMLGLTVQNFISAATGLALLIALIRGLTRYESTGLGNFWVDLVRGILYILLPLSFIFALFLTSQGVIQNFKPYEKAQLIEPISYSQQTGTDTYGKPIMQTVQINTQDIPMGPAASQIAIKQLGSNGGGFFNTNSAHPFENPTPLTNFFELLAIILLPASLCYTYGVMVKDKRQGWAILTTMFILFAPCIFFANYAEQVGNPALIKMGIDPVAQVDLYPAGNMEGKETRFGITNSAIWAAATTATSNGSVNAMHDSFTPLGGFVPLWLMHLGEIVLGGIGSGLYGMLMMIILTVFIVGLMVGRSPEYLGKKIEPYEMKMASVAVLFMPMIVLLLTGLGASLPAGISAISNAGAHGFSEILYAFTSMGNNNGSAFAGLSGNNTFYNAVGGFEMLMLRYWIAIPTLALAGSLVRKKMIPATLGTLPTHTILFITLLTSVTIIIGALTFIPALCLGPIVEHLMLWGQYGN